MKQGNRRTNLVPFAGSYKLDVGSYDISQLWYIRKKFKMVTEPSLVSKSIPDPSNDPNQDEVDKIANGTQISSSDDDWTWKTAALPKVWNDAEKIWSLLTMVLCMNIQHCAN